jgi:AcrR family transcriptional regulator
MSSQPATGPLDASRGADRPRAHGGASETERAIFEATERLLADVPLHDLSVAQIISAAGVSRATFYFYFSSKFAVVTGLLAQVMDEVFEVVQPFIQCDLRHRQPHSRSDTDLGQRALPLHSRSRRRQEHPERG